MKKFVKVTSAVAFACAMTVASTASAASGPELFACVAIFDVKMDQESQFQDRLMASSHLLYAKSSFVTERVLRNIDPYSNQYALYSRARSLDVAEQRCGRSLEGLTELLERAPETHVAKVNASYDTGGRNSQPDGFEFGAGEVGQIAHLGLFVPMAEHRTEYDRILDVVKMNTVERSNQGFFGEDVLTEVAPESVEKQNPYTPRAFELVPMSINYGEYASLEDAENAYVRRGEDSTGDPKIRYWYRAFFSALQVPHRFYIFEVVGNYPDKNRVAEIKRAEANRVASLGEK